MTIQEYKLMKKILLSHFYVMNAWSKNLLTKVLVCDKNYVWRALHDLMFCPNENHFERI